MATDPYRQAFLNFHAEHPEVYELFKKLAFRVKKTGRKSYGAWTIFNVIRWEYDLNHSDEFKVNNNYIAYYSRLLIREHPEFQGFFKTRAMKH